MKRPADDTSNRRLPFTATVAPATSGQSTPTGTVTFLFTDIAGSEGNLAFNIDAQPRLLIDLGKFWDAPNSVYFGTEVIYWHNKYGVKGVNEFAPQAMIKFVM